MIKHWFTIFNIPAMICSGGPPQFTGRWFKAMCAYMGIRHATSPADVRL